MDCPLEVLLEHPTEDDDGGGDEDRYEDVEPEHEHPDEDEESDLDKYTIVGNFSGLNLGTKNRDFLCISGWNVEKIPKFYCSNSRGFFLLLQTSPPSLLRQRGQYL